MARLRPLSSLLLVLALAACTGSGGGSTSIPADGSTTSTAVTGETTTTAPPLDITELPGTESLPEEVQQELIELVQITQELRGLNFIEPPLISVVSDQELEALVREQFEEEAEDLPVDQALYELLGLLDPAQNLNAILTEVYSEQVLGFYEFESRELVVPMTQEGLSQVQRATLVHELTHALTDQHFDIFSKYEPMFDEERFDEASAYQALIEGDASLAEVLFLRTLSQQELGEFVAEALDVGSAQFDAAPEFIQDSLIFPYDSGLTFVQELYTDADGWDTINAAYEDFVTLPASTEQVITPDDYGRDLPVEVRFPDIEVPGYELRESSVWGELGLRILFDEVLGDAATLTAADGWGGDRYSVWYDGSNAVFVMVYAGDTDSDESEAEDALLEFATTSVPEEAFVWVEVIDGQLTFIASDVPSVGETIRDDLKG